MNKFVSIFITFLSILSACSEKENTREICFRERESVPVSELMADYSLIKLETCDENLILDASIVRLWNGRIYILDCFSQAKGFFVFNLEGKYLGRIGTVGAGLGEYIMPMGMVIDPIERHVIVKDVAQNKLLFFDAESFTFLKEERLPFYSDCLEYAASGQLVWYNGAGCKNEGTFQNHLQLTDMEANLLDSRIAQMDFPRRAPYNVLTYFHRYDDLIYFHHPFMNEFYRYNPADKTLQPAYTLTFEKLKMPSEEFIIENKNSII